MGEYYQNCNLVVTEHNHHWNSSTHQKGNTVSLTCTIIWHLFTSSPSFFSLSILLQYQRWEWWEWMVLYGLIMSKYLRGDIRDYWCWHVRGASRHAASLCPLQSLSFCTAQWPCRCLTYIHPLSPNRQTSRCVSHWGQTLCWDSSKMHKVIPVSTWGWNNKERPIRQHPVKPQKTVQMVYYHPKLGSFYKHWYNRV